MAEVEFIVTEDESSGRFHKRIRFEGKTWVQEGCNLDDADAYKVLPRVGMSRGIDGRGVWVGTDQSNLCKNCWPDGQ